jgi:hypothetical protein
MKPVALGLLLVFLLPAVADANVTVQGEVLDAATRQPLPARVQIKAGDGTWHFPTSAAAEGSAVRYERQRANTNSMERHTTLSGHPFRVELPPGRYTFTIERGKEYHAETREVVVAAGMERITFQLRRWAQMAAEGWFSGDTHVHREPGELANVMLAEDLNVAFPLLDWAVDSHVPPSASERSTGGTRAAEIVRVDATHAWSSRNTEYEITRVQGREHRLGAFLILNHRTRFDRPLAPLSEIVRQARAEGALIDLEKPNWPWSIALAPLLGGDLFELANNHHWQTDYAVKNWAVPAPAWMKLSGTGTDTERDWTLYGFQTYYALLNCGFRLRPTAGTASGVHPVPLGFNRVYVQLDGPFSYEKWIEGLRAGRSFVTNSPLLRAKANGRWPGAEFGAGEAALQCSIRSAHPLESVELIANGEVVQRFEPTNRSEGGGFTNEITTRFRPTTSTWIAWRCFEARPDGRLRFAHSAPWYFDVPNQPLRLRRIEADWLVQRVTEEIARSRDVAPRELIDEYQRALKFYQDRAAVAR